MDAERIRPFWLAVLGYTDVDGDAIDPLRDGPGLWFQQMDEPRADRNRIHLDISVAHDVAEQRIAAALAAGGTLVSDRRAKASGSRTYPRRLRSCPKPMRRPGRPEESWSAKRSGVSSGPCCARSRLWRIRSSTSTLGCSFSWM